jgi:hypothetical protein
MMDQAADRPMKKKKKDPGWRIRCLKCGFTEPHSKPGGRLGIAGRKYISGRCPNCRRVRFHVIEKVTISPFGDEA